MPEKDTNEPVVETPVEKPKVTRPKDNDLADRYRNITGLDPEGLTAEQLNAVVNPGA